MSEDYSLKDVIIRLDGIDARLDGIDARLDGIDARLDGIDARLDGLEKRTTALEASVSVLDEKITGLEKQMNFNFVAIAIFIAFVSFIVPLLFAVVLRWLDRKQDNPQSENKGVSLSEVLALMSLTGNKKEG